MGELIIMNLCLHIFIPRGVRFLEEMRSRHPRIQFWSQLVDQGWLRGIANTRQECSFHCPHYCAPQKASLLNLASNLRKRISGKINKAVSYCPIATYAYTIIYICHHMPHHHLHENLWQVNVANISQKPRDKKILIPYHDVPRGRLKEGIGPIHERPQQWQHPKHGPLTCHAIAWQTVPTGAVRQKARWISRILLPSDGLCPYPRIAPHRQVRKSNTSHHSWSLEQGWSAIYSRNTPGGLSMILWDTVGMDISMIHGPELSF